MEDAEKSESDFGPSSPHAHEHLAAFRADAPFRKLVESAPDGIFIHDQGRLLYANPAFLKALGYDGVEELPRPVHSLIHPEDVPKVRAREKKILASGQPSAPEEVRLLCKNGTYWSAEAIGMTLDHEARPYFLVFLRDITERKRAEAVQKQWESMFKSTAWGVVMSDGERVTIANPAFVAMHGFTAEEMIGMPVAAVFAPEERRRLAKVFEEIDRTGHFAFESVHLRKDGTRFPVLIDATAVVDEQGKLLYRAAYVQDITARKAAEDALRRSESNLARAQQIAKLGSWDWDLQTNQLAWSNEMFRLYGLSRGNFEPAPRAAYVYVHPADRDELTRATEAALKGAGSFVVDYRIRRPSGESRILHTEGSVLYDERHDPVRMVGTVQDVTESRRAAMEREQLIAELDEERARLEAVIETSPVAIFVHQGEAKLTFNRRAAEWFGPISPDEGIAPFARKMYRRDGQPFRKEELPAVRALRGEVVDAEEVLYVDAFRERSFLVSASPIRDAAGTISAAVTAVQDITAIKEYERLRDQWTSVIAHDLRQPLTAITAYAELLAAKSAAAGATDPRLEHIVESAKQMRRMISDLLDITSIEARHLKLVKQPVELKRFLSRVIERSAGYTKGHAVEVFIDKGTPARIDADPGRLEQILNNLLSNAVKYGRQAAVIEVNVEPHQEGVRFSVENEGEGITPAELPHLFERFRRAAKNHGIKGLGLGLYITKGLVESHGGRIWGESTPGERTAFRFTLPVS